MAILDQIYSIFPNNTIGEYLTSLTIFLSLFLFFIIFDFYIIKFFQKITRKTKFTLDDLVVDFIEALKWPFYAFISLYISILFIEIPLFLQKTLDFFLVLVLAYYLAGGLIEITNHLFDKYREKKKNEDKLENQSLINVLRFLVILFIWSLAFLMVLSNIGINITPMIASLGVGGIAIALALQSILGDLFSAFTIYFDKPFKEGDFIVVGEDMGVVKNIGIKTTRIEALSGQEIVISNSELTGSRINNYKKMEKRRVVFSFGVTYDTSLKKLKKINSIVEEIIKKIPDADLDRCHFKEFGDSSLNYEIVYYVKTRDYNKYMDIQQEINFKIIEKFEKEKIEMAFPTRTLYLKKN